jgi:hypothetical protein
MKNRRACLLTVLLFAAWLPAQAPAPGNHQTTLRIRARVLDAEGQPLAAAGLVIGPTDAVTTTAALTRPHARSAKDGTLVHELSLTTEELAPFTMLIAAPGKVAVLCPYPVSKWRYLSRATGEVDLGDIRLPNGHNLSGRVRDAAGAPIAGARICAVDCLATYSWLEPSYGSQAITDERGVFVLPGVFAEAMVVDVTAAGFFDRHFPWTNLATPLDVQLEPSGFVEGKVVAADGKPLACSVMLTSEFLGAQRQFVPAPSGSFRLSLGKPGRFRVTAYLGSQHAVAESSLLHGPATGIELRSEPDDSQSFVVRAVDATRGEPIAAIQAAVFWFPGDLDTTLESILLGQVQPAASDGKVRLSSAPAAARQGVVCVLAPGHAPFFQAHVEHQPGEPFVARLVPESRVAGRVVDAATGKPLSGVTVTCEREVRKATGRTFAAPPSAQTGADGAFSIGGLGAGKYVVVARRTAGTSRRRKVVELESASEHRDLTLELPIGATVTGKVTGLDAGGGWQLLLGADDPNQDGKYVTGGSLLDAWNRDGAVPIVDGACRFEQRAHGTEPLFLVVPMPPRHGAALRIPVTKVTIGSDEVAFEVDLTAHRPGSIEGKLSVTGAEIPFGRLAVVATPRLQGDPQNGDHAEQIRSRHWSLADGDGRYAIPVAPGSHSLEVVDVATGVVLLSPGEPIQVPAAKRIQHDLAVVVAALRVRLPDGPARPLPAQRVRVLLGDEQRYSGKITLFGGGTWGSPGIDLIGVDRDAPLFVPPGTVRLQVHGGATRIARGSVTFGGDTAEPQAFEAAAGKLETVTLELPAPTPLEEK